MENKRIAEIDYIRGFAIFLVVLGHSIIVYPVNLHKISYCKYLYDLIYSFHMPLFFAVSGYCYNYRGGYFNYLKIKAKRLLLPYFFFAFIGITFKLLLPGLVNRQQDLRESIISVFLYGSEYWFLYTLFLLFVIAPLLERLIEKNLVFTCFILVAVECMNNYIPSIFCLKSVVFYLPCFVLGFIGKKYKLIDFTKDKISILSLRIKILLGIVVFGLILFNGYCHYKLKIVFVDFLEGLVGTILITILILLLTKLFRAFEKYSRYSLPLYLLNGYWLVISRTIIIKFFGITNSIIIILFNVSIDFYLSYIVIRYILSKIPLVKDFIGIPPKKNK